MLSGSTDLKGPESDVDPDPAERAAIFLACADRHRAHRGFADLHRYTRTTTHAYPLIAIDRTEPVVLTDLARRRAALTRATPAK
ncbi:hypothetical protein GCM10009754_15790 [Amycolatopsis minnesotensis]|uniref:Uncharacterized protein n=1 Tax=Amycolatopsis minnesotensis TaxID=337894 RepID=A0ABP5BN54_9PSEU